MYSISSKSFDNEFYIGKSTTGPYKPIKEINEKFSDIAYNMVSKEIYEKIKNDDLCIREEKIFNNKLIVISLLFDYLNKDGNFFLAVMGFCNDQIIEIFYILSFMFDYCVIYNSTFIVCKNFNPIIKKEDFENIINKDFFIEPKYKLNDLVYYLENNLKYHTKKLTILLENKEDAFLDIIFNELVSSFKYYNKKEVNDFIIEYNKSIITNFKRVLINNKLMKTSSAINGKEGLFLINIIKKYNFKKCLEVGMAYGISAFYILTNQNVNLISIDPFQNTQWNNYGMNLLKEFNFDKRHELYEMKNYIALPKLLDIHSNTFDCIFIDGFHTFDYTLLDFFYSNLLLKLNGIIIIDDALHYGVSKCIKYIENNYNFYKKLDSPVTFAMFQKINEDKREWNFHKEF
jgi:predicted O-methyltransferase YrrM